MDKPITDDSVLLSIVIPAYNVEEYIGECLESVIGQDIDNYEIICVEDHAADILLDMNAEKVDGFSV